jgi:hypothetical protein
MVSTSVRKDPHGGAYREGVEDFKGGEYKKVEADTRQPVASQNASSGSAQKKTFSRLAKKKSFGKFLHRSLVSRSAETAPGYLS